MSEFDEGVPLDAGLSLLAELLDDLLEPWKLGLRGQVDVQTARWVLYVCEGDVQLGQDPGGFKTDLIRLMQRADDENMIRLSGVWPALAFTVDQWRTEGDSVEWLRGIVHAYEAQHAAAFGLPEPEVGS